MYLEHDDLALIHSWIMDEKKDPQTYLQEYEWLEVIIPKMFAELMILRKRNGELHDALTMVRNEYNQVVDTIEKNQTVMKKGMSTRDIWLK